jgi:hypothetical protein
MHPMKNLFETEENCYKHLKLSAELLHDLPWHLILEVWSDEGLFTPDFTSKNPQSWANVCAHSATAAILANKLSSELLYLGYTLSAHDVTLSTILHDWNKKGEVEQLKISRDVESVKIFNQKSIEKISRIFGARIAQLALCTGDLGYDTFINGKFGCEELVVFYSDICTSGQHVVGYEERFRKLQEHFVPGCRYEHTEQYFQNRYGKSWLQSNLEVVYSLEDLFRSKGNHVGPELSCSLVPDWCL